MIMSEIISNKITNALATNKMIDTKLTKVYQYSLEYLLDIIIYNLSILLLGWLLRCFLLSLLYLIVTTFLRKFSGGFHASTRLQCSILSYFFYFITIFSTRIFFNYTKWYSFLFSKPNVATSIYLCAALLIVILSPVIHPNKHMNYNDKRRLKKNTALTILIISIFFYILLKNRLQIYCLLIIICMMVNIISLVTAKILYRRKSNES